MPAADTPILALNIDDLRYLLTSSPNQRLLILWDGASYHRSQAIRSF